MYIYKTPYDDNHIAVHCDSFVMSDVKLYKS